MARKSVAQADMDGLRTARRMRDADRLTADTFVDALDPNGSVDLFITPWKRGSRAAIRSACGY